MAYNLDGRLLEVCTCKTLCPCWIGEDPDFGTCQAIVGWHIDHGTIDGVDVSGLTMASLGHVPGNILQGNWRVVLCVDGNASDAQHDALLAVWRGKHTGPIADLMQLVGEVVAIDRVPIAFTVEGGQGSITIGTQASAQMAPYTGATGLVTTLHDSIFSTIPGSPAFIAKASNYVMNEPRIGANVNIQGFNAVQGAFHFEA